MREWKNIEKHEEQKMKENYNKEESKDSFEARKPDWRNYGVGVWEDEKGTLTIKIVGHNTIRAFPNDGEDGKEKE